ncbi:MAG TPA: TlpA disulfide reductase family protein [Pseudomonas sp.]|uniref:TlpA disulfide reductase family protein n=1 Tax=Pseudomonas sp. TaxID=306 RepID=UPI002ED96C4C
MLSFSLGPLALSITHLLLLIALVLATLVGWLVGRKQKINPEKVIFSLFLSGVLIARLSFVIVYWAQYHDNLTAIIDIRDGGFLTWPGVITVLLGGALYGWKRPSLRGPLGSGVGLGLAFWLLANIGISYQEDARLPDPTLRNVSGEPVRLSDYQGKKLVINLWATWCPPCRREMPVLQAAQQAHEDVVFLFVNQAESPRTVATFLAAQGLHLNNLLFDSSGQLAQQVGSAALPTTLFYTQEGRLLATHLGELSAASLKHTLDSFSPAAPSSISLSRSAQ